MKDTSGGTAQKPASNRPAKSLDGFSARRNDTKPLNKTPARGQVRAGKPRTNMDIMSPASRGMIRRVLPRPASTADIKPPRPRISRQTPMHHQDHHAPHAGTSMDFILTDSVPTVEMPRVPGSQFTHMPEATQVKIPKPEADPDLVKELYTQEYPQPKLTAKQKAEQAKLTKTDAQVAKPGKLISEKEQKLAAKKAARAWYWKVLDIAQYPLYAVIAIAAAASTEVGQWFILIYIVLSLIRRQESRVTFALAIFLLVAIPVFQLLEQEGIAQNTAVYAYELLVFGTAQAMFEVFKSSRNKNKKI